MCLNACAATIDSHFTLSTSASHSPFYVDQQSTKWVSLCLYILVTTLLLPTLLSDSQVSISLIIGYMVSDEPFPGRSRPMSY